LAPGEADVLLRHQPDVADRRRRLQREQLRPLLLWQRQSHRPVVLIALSIDPCLPLPLEPRFAAGHGWTAGTTYRCLLTISKRYAVFGKVPSDRKILP